MRHLILAIIIIALIVYSTNIIGCRSTGTTSGSTYSSEEGKGSGAPNGRDFRGGFRAGGGGP
jgi:outer membrane lipoprotein SlyB